MKVARCVRVQQRKNIIKYLLQQICSAIAKVNYNLIYQRIIMSGEEKVLHIVMMMFSYFTSVYLNSYL